ncbi:hypothetical protein ACFLYF_05395, partial [Chloroflexota bacterium]
PETKGARFFTKRLYFNAKSNYITIEQTWGCLFFNTYDYPYGKHLVGLANGLEIKSISHNTKCYN